jgi:predicted ATPase
VGDYTGTDVRRETLTEAEEIHRRILYAYAETGLPIVTLPGCDLEQRVDMATQAIASF